MRQWLALIALLLVGSAAEGASGLHGSGPVGCALRPGFTDGCVGANTNGSVQHSDFFTSRALQSGQTYVTRPPWNVAGVDYPVGVPTGLSLKDPSTATLPTGCAYSASRVVCQSTSANITFDGWDFGLHNGINLQFNGSVTGNVTVKNSNFAWGTSITGNNHSNLIVTTTGSGPASLTIANCSFDGGGAIGASAGNASLIQLAANNVIPFTVTYSSFVGASPRVVSTNGSGSIVSKYNYTEGLNYTSAQFTGAIDNGSGTGSPVGSTLTVTAVARGVIAGEGTLFQQLNLSIVWPTIVADTIVTARGTGTGGTGTYTVSPGSQGVTPQTMYQWPAHGDGYILVIPSGATVPLYQTSYNTFLATTENGASTAWVTPYEGADDINTMTSWIVDHSVIVSNIPDPTITSLKQFGYLVGDNHRLLLGSTLWDSNYLDPTSAFGCFLFVATSGSPAPTMTGNINLLTGNPITASTGACP